MDSRQIEQLLEKYWSCETSLEEEQQLRDYFQQSEFPESLRETAELFRYFESEKGRGLKENFESVVTKELRQRQGGKIISMVSLKYISRIAAGILVVVVATIFIRQEIRKSYPKEMQDTYTDPQMAFEETKKALQMISNSFGKARKEASKVKMLNDAEKKIERKQAEEKVSI